MFESKIQIGTRVSDQPGALADHIQFLKQPAFADARLTAKVKQAAARLTHASLHRLLHDREFPVASQQSALRTAVSASQAQDPVQLDRLRNAFQRCLNEKLGRDVRPAGKAQGIGDHNVPRTCQTLHTRCQINGFAHHSEAFRVTPFTEREHHFPKTDADGRMQGSGALRAQRRHHIGLDRQCGSNGAHGIVTMGDGRAKNGHDRVTDVALHRTAKSVHDRRHLLGVSAHDDVQIFRIELG